MSNPIFTAPVPCHIFLDKFQKYMNIHKQTGSKALADNTYIHQSVCHAQNQSKIFSNREVSTKLSAFKLWLEHLPKIKLEEVQAIEFLIEENKQIAFWIPYLSLTPIVANENDYSLGIEKMMKESINNIQKFNKNIDAIKAIITPYKSGPNAFMIGAKVALTVANIMPSKIKLGKTVQDVVDYALTQPQDVMDSIKNLKAAKADTSGLFFIYQNLPDRNNDGFVGLDRHYAALNEAEIFYDGAKAQRSAKARGLKCYQIWEASLNFNKPIFESSDFVPGSNITTIISRQEKEQIEKAIASKEYQNMAEKLAMYEEILERNNLLPEKPLTPEHAEKKRQKI